MLQLVNPITIVAGTNTVEFDLTQAFTVTNRSLAAFSGVLSYDVAGGSNSQVGFSVDSDRLLVGVQGLGGAVSDYDAAVQLKKFMAQVPGTAPFNRVVAAHTYPVIGAEGTQFLKYDQRAVRFVPNESLTQGVPYFEAIDTTNVQPLTQVYYDGTCTSAILRYPNNVGASPGQINQAVIDAVDASIDLTPLATESNATRNRNILLGKISSV